MFVYLLGALSTVLVGLASFTIYVAIAILPTYLLWNWLMPSIFHIQEVTFCEAGGLLLLTGFLLKGRSTTIEARKPSEEKDEEEKHPVVDHRED